MSRGAQRVAALALGLLLALLVAEVAVRLAPRRSDALRLPLSFDHQVVSDFGAGRRSVRFDPDVGWLPTPDFDAVVGDVHERSNHAGLRADREYSAAPAPGVRRILAYGDSFTHCDDVDIKDCWTTRLEQQLLATEVLNLGVGGSAPDQAWVRFQRDGSAWHPCAVLIGSMVENINRVVNRFRPFYYPAAALPLAKPRFVLQDGRPQLLPIGANGVGDLEDGSWVEAHLGPRDAWYFPGMLVPNPLDRLDLVRLLRTADWLASRRETEDWTTSYAEKIYQPGEEAFETLGAVLAGFAEQVRADGATPIVLVFPARAEVTVARDGGYLPHTKLVEALERRGVPTIDLTPPLADEARRSTVRAVVEFHYRPQGNLAVARALAARVPELAAVTCGRS